MSTYAVGSKVRNLTDRGDQGGGAVPIGEVGVVTEETYPGSPFVARVKYPSNNFIGHGWDFQEVPGFLVFDEEVEPADE